MWDDFASDIVARMLDMVKIQCMNASLTVLLSQSGAPPPLLVPGTLFSSEYFPQDNIH